MKAPIRHHDSHHILLPMMTIGTVAVLLLSMVRVYGWEFWEVAASLSGQESVEAAGEFFVVFASGTVLFIGGPLLVFWLNSQRPK